MVQPITETKKPGRLEPAGPYSLTFHPDTPASHSQGLPVNRNTTRVSRMVSVSYQSDHSKHAAQPENPVDTQPRRLSRAEQNDLIAWVQVWHDAGCAVHPAKADGSKTPVNVRHGSDRTQPDTFPAVYPTGKFAGMPHPQAGQPNPEAGQFGYGWKRIATGDLPRLTVDQIAAHIRTGRADGIGVICGRASGGVFMLEAEGRARDLLPRVRDAAIQQGCLDLLERLAGGCVDESPSGGLHFYLRSDGTVAGNTVLAARPNPAAEHGRDVLFETRGQGGWSAVAPSAGRTHKSGRPYRFVRGGPSTIPTFSPEEIDRLFDVFRAVDEMPKPDPAVVAAERGPVVRRDRPAGEILPGDDFNARASWQEILIGWKWMHSAGGRTYLNRPGVDDGRHRAVIDENDLLCVFTTSTALPDQKSLSKFATYAHLHHGGDFAAAARELWYLGYGSRHDDHDGGDGQPVPVEPRPEPSGDCRTLADWRAEVAQRRAASVAQPGTISLDRSPTGSGKTHATIEALRQASSSLTVLPTHANVVERVAEMQGAGIDAVAFPELTPDTCQQFDAASQAQRLGLVAGAAVCPSCDFKDVCAYRAGVKAAESAAHRVGTHERLRRSGKSASGVQVVVVDETPDLVMSPTLHVSVKQLAPVDLLAHGIRNYWHSEANPDQKSFARALQDVVAAIHAACTDITTAGVRVIDLSVPHQVPDNWQRLLFDSIRSVGVGQDLTPEALTLVTKAAAGELTTLTIVTDLTLTGRLHHYVVGSWRPEIPAEAAVMLLDATGDAADIEAAIDHPVVDTTPVGHLSLHHAVVQIPDDISRSTSADTVAGHIEAFLAARPEVQRLGIIGHKPHIQALLGEGGILGAAAQARVSKWCWFGQGPDRASNEWHVECDHVLVLGTPRANPGDYRRWLAQHGLHDAAGMVDGDWGPRDWQAATVDGQPVTIHGRGYRHPDWHRAFTAVCRSTLHQSVGRGRSILPEGIPVTVLTCEPTPYPIAPSLVPMPSAVRETVEIVRKMGTHPVGTLLGQSAKNAIENPYRTFCASGPFRSADVVQAIMAAAQIDQRAAQVRLAQCRKAGVLTQPRRGWWALPEAADTPVPDAPPVPSLPKPVADHRDPPAAPPAPAMILPPVQAVVVTATGPTAPAPAVDVVADTPAVVTTTTCTSTVQPVDAPEFDDLMALIDERAAIMEHDGGLDRDTADRLAREMVLGRDATAAPPEDDIVVAVDHPALHAATLPYPRQVLARISGTARVIDDRDDPFARARRRHQPRQPGVCQCGHDEWVQIRIHGGASVRVDCRHCDRFGWFSVWYGKRRRAPWDDHDDRADQQPTAAQPGATFDFLSATQPALLPAG